MTTPFDILFFDSSDLVVAATGGVTFELESYTLRAQGGPAFADISARGQEEALGSLLGLLGYRVLAVARDARAVWHGTVERVTVPSGKRQISLSLDGMANRVAVAYTEDNARYTTAWAQDNDSVSFYGTRERLLSLSVGREQQAEAVRDTQLEILKQPAPSVTTEGGNGKAVLSCAGYWQGLGRRYYTSTEGYERHLTGSAIEKIGQSGLTGSGWRFEGNKAYWGSEYHAPDTDAIQKTGQLPYTATTIGFEDGTDGSRAYDTAGGFGAFLAGDVITVSGTTLNDGTYTLSDATATHLTSLDDMDDENPGGSVTITPSSYVQLAQSFQTVGGVLRKVRVRAARCGSASDGLLCAILANSGGSPSGTQLDGATVLAADMSTEVDWITFEYGGGFTLSNATTYWLVLIRTGTPDASSGYAVAVDEGLGYGTGVMKVYNGSSWIARPTPADMVFEVIYSPSTTLGAFVSGDTVTVDGSSSNDGTYTLNSVQTEEYPWYLQSETAFDDEPAGSSVTVAPRYTKVAQRLRVNDAAGWFANLARVKVRKVGTSLPTDGLTLQIHADSAGAIGSSLATATVDAADISTSSAWVSADFGTTLELTAGTYYWLSVKRTGSDSSQTGYVVAVDDDAGYTDGVLQGWDGSAWGNRTPGSDLVFELVGVRETTQILKDILTATGMFAGVDVRASSGLYASPYFDGDSLAQGEVERLLKAGTASGSPLVATVTPERWVRIDVAPDVYDAYGMKAGGQFVDAGGVAVAARQMQAGVWLTLLDLPGTINVAALGTAAQLFVEELDYNAARDTIRLRYRQNRDPLSMGMREG